MPRNIIAFCLFGMFILFMPEPGGADLYFYDGQVDYDVKRDRIIAIAEDYATLHYYVAEKNIDTSNCPNSICPDPVAGWKTGIVYCWGGDNTTSQFLYRLKEEDAVYGNKKTWNPTSGGETGFSDVACWRDNGSNPSVILVDGADRYREQHGHNHAFLARHGKALEICGAGFDFASNEAVVDEKTGTSWLAY